MEFVYQKNGIYTVNMTSDELLLIYELVLKHRVLDKEYNNPKYSKKLKSLEIAIAITNKIKEIINGN